MNGIYEEIRIALHTVWLRRWLALGVAWAVCLLGWLVVSLIPNRYEARARVLVETESVLAGKVGMTENDTQRDIDRMRQTLVSADNLEKVVRATALARQATTDAEVSALAAQLGDHINITALPDNFFEISAQTSGTGLSNAENAQLAHDVVQKLIDLFAASKLSQTGAEAKQSLQFLDAEIARRGKELRAADSKRVQFEDRFLGGMPGTGSIEQRIDAARTELENIEPQLSSARGSLAAVNAQMSSTPATMVVPSVGVSRTAVLEQQLADALARGWTEKHPDIISLRGQIARAKASGEGNVAATAPNPLYISLRSMQAERQAAASALEARRGELQANLNRLVGLQVTHPEFVAEQSRLSRDYDALKEQYDKLISDREDIRLRGDVASRSEAVRFRVVQAPSRPRLPISPNRLLLLVGVLIVGVGAGMGTAFVKGQLRTTYPTANRLAAATGLTVLGSIPETLSETMQAERLRGLKWFAGGAAGLAGALLLLIVIEFVQRGLTA